jgi:hypothetical protein
MTRAYALVALLALFAGWLSFRLARAQANEEDDDDDEEEDEEEDDEEVSSKAHPERLRKAHKPQLRSAAEVRRIVARLGVASAPAGDQDGAQLQPDDLGTPKEGAWAGGGPGVHGDGVVKKKKAKYKFVSGGPRQH